MVDQVLEDLKRIVAQGGPVPDDYAMLDAIWDVLHHQGRLDVTRHALGNALDTLQTMQGFAYVKPHGYAGDYEMIDRIYQEWKSPEAGLSRWDEYFHQKSAARAVRNRKRYFHALVQAALDASPGGEFHILNVASGPARDIAELADQPGYERVRVDCIELDAKAIEYAQGLTRRFEGRVRFLRANALRFRPDRPYDLIWSAGLMDYFTDKHFVRFLARMRRHLRTGGEVVLGNFGPANCSRSYMEVVGEWVLAHRSRRDLVNLAVQAGASPRDVRVDSEPERVNLFLRVSAGASDTSPASSMT